MNPQNPTFLYISCCHSCPLNGKQTGMSIGLKTEEHNLHDLYEKIHMQKKKKKKKKN